MSDKQLIRYADDFYMQKIDLILADPLCKILFEGLIDTVPLHYRFTPLDIEPHVDQGVVTYTLHPEVANELWAPIRRLGQLIVCAAYDYNPYAFTLPLPKFVSMNKLIEIGMESPDLTRVFSTPIENPLLAHFPSARLLRDRIVLVQKAIERGLDWVGRAMEATLEN
ncbi:hypothetical protein H0H93_013866 [Arthromyces matolae]|nr:hypothetical protein H0H93_013866 [Arthromyces matolae]